MSHKWSRRQILALIAAAGAAAGGGAPVFAQTSSQVTAPIEEFTGPDPNPHWNAVGPYVIYPQKVPLILLTDRPPVLETPRIYFTSPLTPNAAFYVRWHLDVIPRSVDLATWRLSLEGHVEKPLLLTMADLLRHFPARAFAAVNQCSGNSRSRFQPRVPGAQWGNGGMGNALWTGVLLADLLKEARVKSGALVVQMQGLDRGKGPKGKGSREYLKSVDINDPRIGDVLLAYAMNGEPLPMLNGFPLRAVVPGNFSTYWVKSLAWLRVLDRPDDNYWSRIAYRIPEGGNVAPEDAGKASLVPVGEMPVRSFIISPEPGTRIPAGMAITIRGIAFGGKSPIARVEVSTDGGENWQGAALGIDYGAWSFREWHFPWKPARPGRNQLAVRAFDERGRGQADNPIWNPGGYLWNKIERQEVVAGDA